MITGKIILKSATKLSLDQRFSEIAKHAPPTPARIQQQTHVIIPRTRQELFGNGKRSNTLSIAQRLKKRSINNRLGRNNNVNQMLPKRPRVFQRLGFNNRRQQTGNSYLFGGQSGLGVRLRGQGRIGGPRKSSFRSRTRGYLNNKMISRVNRNSNNHNNNNRGKRFGNNNNRTRFNRSNRGKPNGQRARPPANTKRNVSKETLDSDLDKYMSQTKIENDSVDMNAV